MLMLGNEFMYWYAARVLSWTVCSCLTAEVGIDSAGWLRPTLYISRQGSSAAVKGTVLSFGKNKAT
jgi:hypothetical protein